MLADKDKSQKCLHLLESRRIRATCSDIVKAFKWLHDTLEEIDVPSDDVTVSSLKGVKGNCKECVYCVWVLDSPHESRRA
jgi:hypothetical protein